MAVTINDVSLTVTVTGGPGNPRDFVGIYREGSQLNEYLVWGYIANDKMSPRPTVGVSNGTVHLRLANPIGGLEIRFISIDSNGVMSIVPPVELIDFGPWNLEVKLSPPEGAEITGPNSWQISTPDGVTLDVNT